MTIFLCLAVAAVYLAIRVTIWLPDIPSHTAKRRPGFWPD